MKNLKSILFIGIYDVSKMNSARAVRIRNLSEALQNIAPTTIIACARNERRRALWKYIISGDLKHTRAIYIETPTSSSTEMDILLLTLARVRGIPIIAYFPDAYQYFPELFPTPRLLDKIIKWRWVFFTVLYQRLAHLLLYPTWELAACFRAAHEKKNILPPGGKSERTFQYLKGARPVITYIGNLQHRDGGDILLDAMAQVVDKVPDVKCRIISGSDTPVRKHPQRQAPWLSIEKANFDELPAILSQATLAVIPRRRSAYMDLALPIKLMDYLSFGLPVLVTDCTAMARFIKANEVGVVVQADATSLATGILKLLEAPGRIEQLSKSAYQGIQKKHSWEKRAEQLLAFIEELERR